MGEKINVFDILNIISICTTVYHSKIIVARRQVLKTGCFNSG